MIAELIIIVVAIVILVWVCRSKGYEGFGDGRGDVSGIWYEYNSPTVDAEHDYWHDALCDGLPDCDKIYKLENIRRGSFKGCGTTDIADYVCLGQGFLPGTKDYDVCMTNVYSDYRYP